MNPTPCDELRNTEDATTVRRLDCDHYRKCLNWAVFKDWPSFTCNACEVYEMRDREQHAIDTRLLAALGEAIVAAPALRDSVDAGHCCQCGRKRKGIVTGKRWMCSACASETAVILRVLQ